MSRRFNFDKLPARGGGGGDDFLALEYFHANEVVDTARLIWMRHSIKYVRAALAQTQIIGPGERKANKWLCSLSPLLLRFITQKESARLRCAEYKCWFDIAPTAKWIKL